MLTLAAMMKDLRGLRYFHPEKKGEPPVIPLHYRAGKIPLVAVVGPNAGGKSFVRRILGEICRRSTPKVEFIQISMEMRTGTGAHAGNIMRSFVFGDEGYRSTGDISARTVTTGISTCRSREAPHVVLWDEPDIGLSDGYAAGVGQSLAGFARELPKHTVAAFVITHSKALLRQVAPLKPHYVHVGDVDPPKTLDAWLKSEAPVLSIETLHETATARFKAIQTILNSLEKR